MVFPFYKRNLISLDFDIIAFDDMAAWFYDIYLAQNWSGRNGTMSQAVVSPELPIVGIYLIWPLVSQNRMSLISPILYAAPNWRKMSGYAAADAFHDLVHSLIKLFCKRFDEVMCAPTTAETHRSSKERWFPARFSFWFLHFGLLSSVQHTGHTDIESSTISAQRHPKQYALSYRNFLIRVVCKIRTHGVFHDIQLFRYIVS